MKNMGIIGCGWLGLHLVQYFKKEYDLYCTYRTNAAKLYDCSVRAIQKNFSDFEILANSSPWEMLSALDVVVITLPFSSKSSLQMLKNRLGNLFRFIDGYEKQIFFTSSIGIYPPVNKLLKEDTFAPKQLNDSLRYVEDSMQEKFPAINILRLGGLMGVDRYLSKYAVSSLHHFANHVHYEDVCGVVERMINHNCQGKVYNVVAPMHPLKEEILNYQKNTNTIADKVAEGKRVSSAKLMEELGYTFKHPNPIFFDFKPC